MRLTDLERTAYLGRIGLPDADPTTSDGLARLHLVHHLAVPFESLDIHLGTPIDMSLTSVFDKLVTRRRGGFCYENNTLLAAALGSFGLEPAWLSAEVARPDGTFGPPFDHLVLRLDGDDAPLLLDVGFGENFRHPLPVDANWHDQGPSRPHRAREVDGRLLVENQSADGEVAVSYRVDPTPRAPHDFHAMCRYHQTSPDSGFTKAWVASRATAAGRITATPWRVIETHDGDRDERELASPQDLATVLADRLGIVGLDLGPLGAP